MVELVKKRRKNWDQVDEEDRISGLPDSMVQHILSFLGMKDVIRTSLLSKRWRYLWTSVPVLDFKNWRPADPDIATIIGLTLLCYEGKKIRRFSAYLDDDYFDGCHIDSWIRFVVRHNVEELDIHSYSSYRHSGILNCYRMSPFLHDCAALRVLKLRNCDLKLLEPFCFRSLTALHLRRVTLTDLDTSGCPLLESLIVEDCPNNLNIHAPNQKFRYLKIDDDTDALDDDLGLTVYAPHLLSIEFTRSLRRLYDLKNLSSMTSAILNFFDMDEAGSDYTNSLVELLNGLSHAKTLKLCPRCIQILTCRETNHLETRRILKLHVWNWKLV